MKTDLPTRLEGAAAGSRELDAEVWACVTGYELFEHDGAGWRYRMKSDDIMRHRRTGHIEPVTTSIDAAVALAERVLPFWAIELSTWGPMNRVTLNECDEDWWHRSKHRRIEAQAATPALALCAAILRAHAEQKEG